ncbi:class I SAM-dependent methyltransferase [Haloterrigena sp. SYSU A558-1]|uniref:Class I SAM-dependent methyltransferase n=1 Tax=Haloterrigena gelatinilytica TaxID=2741724 RepID=A0ABX2LMM0_9EURY|nr:class I SAM-dependent methyltransferase [Haloterrigena gelatinilytica]NUC75066.1 class I SAM-dependent methyltransferase [Haloterrigena gelatinilytica]
MNEKSAYTRTVQLLRDDGISGFTDSCWQFLTNRHITRRTDYGPDERWQMDLIEARYRVGKLLPNRLEHELSTRALPTPGGQTATEAVTNAFSYAGWGEYASIRPMQSRAELIQLADYVSGLEPETVVEVGTALGGTLYVWAQLLPEDTQLVSMDLPREQSQERQTPIDFQATFRDTDIEFLRTDSQSEDTQQTVCDLVDGEIDFLFLDGDHSESGVRRDFELYEPLISTGGMIAFHDIYHADGVGAVWSEVKANDDFKTTEICAPMTRIAGDLKLGIGVAERVK